MLTIISLLLIILETLSLSVERRGEKYVFNTSTLNIHPCSLYSVFDLLLPVKRHNFLVLYSPCTEEIC